MCRYLLVLSLFLLPACASLTTGQNQSLSVETVPVSGARCTLTNDDGTWYVDSTPGSVTVSRSYNALSISCEKPGYEAGHATVESNTKAMAFGNILVGGIIGGAVDAGTGAAYDYPSLVTVKLVKRQE